MSNKSNLPWDDALALRLAYEVHREIGNNIDHYRKDTQRAILRVIRNAVKRNKGPKGKLW